MKCQIIVLLFILEMFGSLGAQRIVVKNDKFYVGENQIWINGANTPWDKWNDFGGDFNRSFWRNHFQTLHDNGINCTRVWISCNGEVGISISSQGFVSGVSQKFWDDLDTLFSIAKEKQVYLMLAPVSFDHFKNYHTNYQSWRNMINSESNTKSYMDNYILPLLKKFGQNPYFFSIDVCNEIIWLNENAECGNISWASIQRFIAMTAATVHENSEVLVTVGDYVKYYSSQYSGNKYSDEALKAQFNHPKAFLDFNKVHYYSWVGRWFDVHFQKTPSSYKMEGKPSMIGECSAKGIYKQNAGGSDDFVLSISDAYETAYNNNWQGVMAWTSNGVDGNGSIKELGPATTAFRNKYQSLVYPEVTTSTKPVNYSMDDFDTNVYPNPVVGNKLFLDVPENYLNGELNVFNGMGTLLETKKITGNHSEISLNDNWPKGYYYIRFLNGNDHKTFKVLIL